MVLHQESRRLSDIWLTVLNPSGGNSDKGLIIEKWESIKETKDSKTYRLEFKKECQGNIGSKPSTLTMPKTLTIEFTTYKGKKAISFPENQLSIPFNIGFLKQIRISGKEIKLNVGRGNINGYGTVDKVEDYEDVKSISVSPLDGREHCKNCFYIYQVYIKTGCN